MPGNSGTIRLAATAFVLAVGSAAFAGRTIYVDDDAAGANDGSSWANAYNYLQDALADANSADKPVEIRVAQGMYKPDRGANQTVGDRNSTFQLINGATLKGGYAGFGEPDPNARDIKLYTTILSGDLDGNDVGPADWKSQMIDVHSDSGWQLIDDLIRWGSRKDNSYTVVTGSGTDVTAVLDGFTITGGQADGTGGNWDSPQVNGAGMYNQRGSPTVVNCTFTRNTTCGYDRRTHGAGMFNSNSSPVLRNCRFIENIAFGANGLTEGAGLFDVNSAPTLTNCVFRDNLVTGFDSDYYGGAVYDSNSNTTFTDCSFIGNHSEGGGGLHSQDNSSASFRQCVFTDHTCAIYLAGCAVNLVHCTFAGNGTAVYSDHWPKPSSMEAVNCIFWDNKNSGLGAFWANVQIRFSDIQGGWQGTGNVACDPCFAQAGHWDNNDTPDYSWDDFWVDGDYHLKSQAGRWDPASESWVKDDVTSPCIDAGDPNSPIGNEPFPNGGRINMGAYAGTAEASKSYFGGPLCETIVAGDINGDCKVDFEDFRILALHWLQDESP